MMLQNCLPALLALAAAPALAQGALGTVAGVQGLATVTHGNAGAVVFPGAPVHGGMHFVTAAGSSVTLRMQSGCTVLLPPHYGLSVPGTASCPQLLASVTPVEVPLEAVPIRTAAVRPPLDLPAPRPLSTGWTRPPVSLPQATAAAAPAPATAVLPAPAGPAAAAAAAAAPAAGASTVSALVFNGAIVGFGAMIPVQGLRKVTEPDRPISAR